ncbi:MAG: hypothetical protein JSU74_10235 [Candidatus Zixiibacteriota bacterium]|nr:MAG: hypothetical protein JSU74_10235 [candidate division Zixibacteria bacterium]
METTLTKTLKTTITLFCLLTVTFFATTDRALGQSMTICPFKIVLNALGKAETVQAVIPIGLQPGYMFSSCNATLWINNEVIAESNYARYCYIDDNLLVYFDRLDVYTNPVLEEMAGSTYTATVAGDMVLVNGEGDEISIPFERIDQVLIVDPEKK